jgi:hypothetical protein
MTSKVKIVLPGTLAIDTHGGLAGISGWLLA